MSPHIFDFDFQLVLRPFGRALEGHVFEEVCGAVVRGRFVARAGVDPDADGGGVGAKGGFGRDAEAGRKVGNVGGGGGEKIGGEVGGDVGRGGRGCGRERAGLGRQSSLDEGTLG